MEILFVLVPVSLVIVAIALIAFIWSVYDGQYEDLEKEAVRILHLAVKKISQTDDSFMILLSS